METLKYSKVLVLAPTGISTVNINGRTIHSGLGIGIDRTFCLLSDKQRVILRNKLSVDKMIMNDQISVVSGVIFFRLNHRLIEIFGCDSKKNFPGLPLIVSGHFYHLPLVNDAPIYSANATIKDLVTFKSWQLFVMPELT